MTSVTQMSTTITDSQHAAGATSVLNGPTTTTTRQRGATTDTIGSPA